jgi:hypothetical protein
MEREIDTRILPKGYCAKKVGWPRTELLPVKPRKSEYARTWGLLSNLEVWVKVRRHGDRSSEDLLIPENVRFSVFPGPGGYQRRHVTQNPVFREFRSTCVGNMRSRVVGYGLETAAERARYSLNECIALVSSVDHFNFRVARDSGG